MAKKALLCGINNYKNQPDLRGCVNDVKDMAQLLEASGFQSADIHTLTNEQVTKSAIQQEWQWLLNGAASGDVLVFHFSGHGSYVPDDQEDESDRLDEITCLYDMDFYNPETFIRDDEWNDMLQQVPPEVAFTVIMDNCHSGTGTRAISVNLKGDIKLMAIDRPLRSADQSIRSASRPLNREEYQQLLSDPNRVLPRYLEPPPEFQHRLIAAARSLPLRTAPAPPGPYLLLAACQDNQTAADAFIEGDFHGAFTYHLCHSLRQSPDLSSTQLIDAVRRQLADNQFLQDPQHEGADRPAPLFGENTPTPTIDPPISIDPLMDRNEPLMTSTSDLTPDNQRLLIEAYMKLLDTLGAAPEQRRLTTPPRTANRHLVYVHGISSYTYHYSDPWWKALAPHVGSVFGDGQLNETRWEVLWSDLVNSRALTASSEQQQLQREIGAVLEERQRQMIAESGPVSRDAQRSLGEGTVAERGGFIIDDFLVYMVNPEMRQKIIDRFTKVVSPLLEQGAQVDIISHSWGTVVAYEGLRELAKAPARTGRVSNFFTVGSALSIGPVRRSLRDENKDGDRPAYVDGWINLDAQGDLVGGMLGDMFEVTSESLNLYPTGCSKGLFGYNLTCAHGSYFVEANLAVNRDIFAKFILA